MEHLVLLNYLNSTADFSHDYHVAIVETVLVSRLSYLKFLQFYAHGMGEDVMPEPRL